MLASADIEAVFVLASMSAHAELSLKAAQAGKHFLVQKPFATDFEAGLAVVDAARDAGVKGLVEPNYWMDPVYMKAKEIIEEGHIGTVHYVLGRTERDFVPLWGGPTFYEREGGGMLFDMGVYLVSALAYLLGPAEKVTGVAAVSVPERPAKFPESVFTEYLKSYQKGDSPHRHEAEWEAQRTVPAVMEAPDNTFTMIEWPGDCLACVVANSVSFVLPPAGPRLFLCGEKGTIAFGVPDSGSRLSVATIDKESPYYVSQRRGGGVGWYHFPGNYFPAWRYTAGSAQHLHDCIVNNTEPLPSIEWGMHVAEIMIKSFESAEQGEALDLETTF
jgi:predicted dehydrogenase